MKSPLAGALSRWFRELKYSFTYSITFTDTTPLRSLALYERDAKVLYCSAISSFSHSSTHPWPVNVVLRRDYFCTPGQQLGWLYGNFSLSVNPMTRLCADLFPLYLTIPCSDKYSKIMQRGRFYSSFTFLWNESKIIYIHTCMYIHIYILLIMTDSPGAWNYLSGVHVRASW